MYRSVREGEGTARHGSPTGPRDHGRLAHERQGDEHRTKLERGRGALGPALELVHTGRAPTRAVLTAELGRHPRHRRCRRRRARGARPDPGRLPARRGRRLPGPPLAPARRRRARAPSRSPPRCTPTDSGRRWSASAAASSPPRPAASRSPPTRRRCSARSSTAGAALLRETGRRCVGAGLAVPSAVAEPEGTALNPLHLAWPAGAPVRDIFAERVRAAGIDGTGLHRQRRQPRRARRAPARRRPRGPHLLCVATGHRGVGGALVLDGRLHTGSSGLALEVGHLTVNPEGRPCHCGSRGCLDVEADPLAFLTAAGPRPGPRGLPAPAVPRPAPRTSTPTRRVRAAAEDLIDRLGLGLAGLVNILNPDRIILGGLHRDPPGRRPGAAARGRRRPQPVGPQRRRADPAVHPRPQQPGGRGGVGVAAGAGRSAECRAAARLLRADRPTADRLLTNRLRTGCRPAGPACPTARGHRRPDEECIRMMATIAPYGRCGRLRDHRR